MPELPDVEAARLMARRVAVGRRITGVWYAADPIVFEGVSPARFLGLLRVRSAPIKAVLLDQGFAAGVGNLIADEVLYQARIDPRRRAHALSAAEARRLRAKIGSVVTTAVRARSDSDRYPRTWLFHDRWGRSAGAVTARGEPIRYATIGGRTTAWVPIVQR